MKTQYLHCVESEISFQSEGLIKYWKVSQQQKQQQQPKNNNNSNQKQQQQQ
jgi:hypothetical protein